MTYQEIVAEIKAIEREENRRKQECKIDRYNTGSIVHKKTS